MSESYEYTASGLLRDLVDAVAKSAHNSRNSPSGSGLSMREESVIRAARDFLMLPAQCPTCGHTPDGETRPQGGDDDG